MAIPAIDRSEAAKSIRGLNELPQRAYSYTKHFAPIYVFNIGRWAGEGRSFWVRQSGTGHSFVIGLCPKPGDKFDAKEAATRLREQDEALSDEQVTEILRGVKAGEFSLPCLVPDPVIEFYPVRLGSPPKAETWEGRRVAQEITNMVPGEDGVGAGKDPNADLRYWGLFIAKGKVPSKEELAEARSWYVKRLERIIGEANELFRDGRAKEILKVHRFAAEERGIKAPWNKDMEEMAEPKKMACPVCLNSIIEGAKKCQHCGEWLDNRNLTAKK